jgi:hypothetical protein
MWLYAHESKLRTRPNLTVNKICDWSTGWGDRLLGTLASVNSLNIDQYIGTDPNTSLHEDYVNISQTFVPSGYVVDPAKDVNNDDLIKVEYKHQFDPTKTLKIQIHKKPAEDLTNEELHEGESDLMLTSIPYFNKELYAGEQQSHRRYQTYENETEDKKSWKEGFLIPFVNQSVKSLRNGGVIAVNTAAVNPKQKIKFNLGGIDIGEHNIYEDLKNIMSTYSMDGINLKYLCELPYVPGLYSSKTMVFKVNKPYADASIL